MWLSFSPGCAFFRDKRNSARPGRGVGGGGKRGNYGRKRRAGDKEERERLRAERERETATGCLQRVLGSFLLGREKERGRSAGARLLNFDQVGTADARREEGR